MLEGILDIPQEPCLQLAGYHTMEPEAGKWVALSRDGEHCGPG